MAEQKKRGRPYSNPRVQQNQEKFDRALATWLENKSDKKAWDDMFLSIHFACSNIVKKILRNVYDPECEELALDATCYCMERIRDHGAQPRRLSAWCWSRCWLYVYKKERVWMGQNVRRMADYSEKTEEAIENREGETEEMFEDRNLNQELISLIQDTGISLAEVLAKVKEIYEAGYSEEECLEMAINHYRRLR